MAPRKTLARQAVEAALQRKTEQQRLDTMANALTALGTSFDPREHTQIHPRDLSATEELCTETQVEALYRHWGCRRHVDELPTEALKKGIDVTLVLKDDAPEDAKKQILDVLSDTKALGYVEHAAQWERLYGGSALVARLRNKRETERGSIIARGSAAPLARDASRWVTGIEIVGFEVVHKHHIRAPEGDPAGFDLDRESPHYSMPNYWLVQPPHVPGQDQREIAVHRDRIYTFMGSKPGRRLRPYEFGWSVLDNFWRRWMDYEAARSSGTAVVHRLAETRHGIVGFWDMLAEGGQAGLNVMRATQQAQAMIRSNLRVMMHDKDDSVTDANIPMTGIQAVIDMARTDVAAAAGMSVQRFFGLQQSGGLNSNDESNAERDDAQIVKMQSYLLPVMNWLVELAISHTGLGPWIETWDVVWPAARVETPEKKEARIAGKSKRLLELVQGEVITPNEARRTLRGDPENDISMDEDDADWAESMIGELDLPPTSAGQPPDEPGEVSASAASVTPGGGFRTENAALLSKIEEVVRNYHTGATSREAALQLIQMAGVGAAQAQQLLVGEAPVAEAEGEKALAEVGQRPSEGVALQTTDETPERYAGIDFAPSEGMVEEAQRALAWRREHGRGGTETGWARARDIANRTTLSPDTWRRIYRYFQRHAADTKAVGFSPGEDGYPSAGRIAWGLWGGNAGMERSRKVWEQMEAADRDAGRADRDWSKQMRADQAKWERAAALVGLAK